MITPLQLQVILQAFNRFERIVPEHFKNNETWQNQTKELVNQGIIELDKTAPLQHDNFERFAYKLTNKGRYYVDLICSIPFPTIKTRFEVELTDHVGGKVVYNRDIE